MKKLYIVFDQLPDKKSGGLLATYISLADILKDKYEIHILSVFNYNKEANQSFPENQKHIINNYIIDNRFYKILIHIKKLNLKKAFKALKSAIYYFFVTNSTRKKIRNLINDDDLVIVSCPAAAMFMPKTIKFILEIHIDQSYFFGKNKLGSLQAKLMTKPTLTLFRTKYDSEQLSEKMNCDYIYNFFDNQNSITANKPIKNKILYVGRITPQKDPLRLLNIAYELKKINPNFILDIYGSGPLEDECKNKIKELNLEKNVFMKGFTTNKNIYSEYSLLWLSSAFEGFGLVIIEAKACGIPTISTDWGPSVYEVIDNNVDGYIINNNIEFAKKTKEILNDTNLQEKLSKNALRNFDKFSKEKAKEKWIYFLENYKTK